MREKRKRRGHADGIQREIPAFLTWLGLARSSLSLPRLLLLWVHVLVWIVQLFGKKVLPAWIMYGRVENRSRPSLDKGWGALKGN
jgi:hypothetical protein